MIEVWFHDLVTLTTDNDMRVKASDCCRVIRAFTRFVILFVRLYDYLISNIIYVKIGQEIRVRSKIVISQLLLVL